MGGGAESQPIWATIAMLLPWVLKIFGFVEKANQVEEAIKKKAKESAESSSPSMDAKNKLNQHHDNLNKPQDGAPGGS